MELFLRNFASLFFLVTCTIVNVYGQGVFTGGFFADNRPYEMRYLRLTQTKDSVIGSMMLVNPNDKGSTQSSTLKLKGTADGNTITLNIDNLFSDKVINGLKQGKNIVLMFPTNSGKILNVTFIPSNENEYNLFLTQWQNELSVIYREEQGVIKLNQEMKKFADNLTSDINAYKSTGIEKDIADIKYALNDETAAHLDLEAHLADMKRNSAVRPMSCYQAYQVVGYDFNQILKYDYNQSLGYAYKQFTQAVDSLEERLSNVEIRVDKTRQTAQSLDLLIKQSKYPIPNLSSFPGDEIQVLEKYQALATSARDNLISLKANHLQILNKSEKIMNEGEAILRAALALVKCD